MGASEQSNPTSVGGVRLVHLFKVQVVAHEEVLIGTFNTRVSCIEVFGNLPHGEHSDIRRKLSIEQFAIVHWRFRRSFLGLFDGFVGS